MFIIKLAAYGVIGVLLSIGGISVLDQPLIAIPIILLVAVIDVMSKFEAW